ncbi:hypothetical protein JX265_003739 [Neoarthrinium moseri]|uniref:Proline dehydrogenase n=1 Tax=Neoarthrinium moseri TaxID=1658444 RepID=A0A9Q0ATB5_9PEZI|nr:uncharacterized protein JN550_002483 [Neoarthrinium moseri]KAI1843843.1 hypothetical protein JX266_009899 [Neoarthrinium moseri]KAI1875054.1 hypothetical protein JN550_002483 [Neoarthrinium moseri]KAI1877731.1 hypothetical protein JX265_003739 [Neoarthrinium moseri]
MIGPSDFLAIKLTGAGPIAVDAIAERRDIPPAVGQALDEICEAVEAQGSRLWMDAEQQVLQPGIDRWTTQLMRKYNRNGKIFIYNTIQAYLKGAKTNLDEHIALAGNEGWGLGIKLVRGAYIEHEIRSLIHDKKEQTDTSYDLCVDTILSRKVPEGSDLERFPDAALFLATHNAPSANKALSIQRERVMAGLPTVALDCGQLVGMADELSFELIQAHEDSASNSPSAKAAAPRVYKCMAWGTVGECMGFLYRRAIENRGAVLRTKHMAQALRHELRRRLSL